MLSLNHQVRLGVGGARSGLSPADSNQVVAGGDEAISRFIHVAEIPRTKRELYMLLLPGLDMDAGEAAQRSQGGARQFREADIQLRHLVAIALAGVLDVHLDIQRATRRQ